MKPDLHSQTIEKEWNERICRSSIPGIHALREWIEDMEDLLELRQAKRAEGKVPGRPLEEVAKDLGL